MQIERKISSSLEYFAEMQLIFYKDTINILNNCVSDLYLFNRSEGC